MKAPLASSALQTHWAVECDRERTDGFSGVQDQQFGVFAYAS